MKAPWPRYLILSSLLATTTVLGACASFNRSSRSSSTPTKTATAAPSETRAGQGRTAATPKEASMSRSRTGTRAPSPGKSMVRHSRALPTGEPSTSAVMLHKTVPVEVQPGQRFDYFLDVSNLTTHALEDVMVTERLPKKMELLSADPAPAGTENGIAHWSIGRLAAGESRRIRIAGRTNETGTLRGCASVEYASRVCADIKVVRPALQLTRRVPPMMLLCDEFAVEYVVTNSGTGTARDVVVSETLPAGLTSTSHPRLHFEIPALEPGQSRKFVARLKASKRGTYRGAAKATAAGDLSVSSEETVLAITEPVLTIDKKGPGKTFIGREFTYEIGVKNVGDAVAKDLRIEDELPANTRFVRANLAGGSTRGKIVWKLGDLPPNAERKVSVTLQGVAAAKIRTTAKAAAYCSRAVSDDVSTEIVGIPAVLLEVIDVEDPIAVGDHETYEIRVTNQGTAPATNIKIACALEDTMAFVSAAGATKGSSNAGAVTFAPLPSLAPGRKATWKVRVRAAKPGDTRFRVRMTSDQIQRPVDETEATYFYQ